jgi:hypothetical protein
LHEGAGLKARPFDTNRKNAGNAIEQAGSEGIDMSPMALSRQGNHNPVISAPKDLLTIRHPAREGCA